MGGKRGGMDSNYVDDLIDDDEVPELTGEWFAKAVPFDQLPESEKRVLRELMAGNVTIRPDPVKKPVTMALSRASIFHGACEGELID